MALMNGPVSRRRVLRAAGTLGMMGTAVSLAGCSAVVDGEVVAPPVVVQQHHLVNSELFRLVSGGGRVCSEWRGVVVSIDVGVGDVTRTIRAVSWGTASTTSTVADQSEPPLSVGEFITISTPKIRPPGSGEQNPAATVTPSEVFGNITTGDRGAPSGASDDRHFVRFDGLPTGAGLMGAAYAGRITGVELVEERRSDDDAFVADVAIETRTQDLVEGLEDSVRVAGRRLDRSDSVVFLLGWAPMDDEGLVAAVSSLARGDPSGNDQEVFDIEGIDAEAVTIDCGSEEDCRLSLEDWVESLTTE